MRACWRREIAFEVMDLAFKTLIYEFVSLSSIAFISSAIYNALYILEYNHYFQFIEEIPDNIDIKSWQTRRITMSTYCNLTKMMLCSWSLLGPNFFDPKLTRFTHLIFISATRCLLSILTLKNNIEKLKTCFKIVPGTSWWGKSLRQEFEMLKMCILL